MAFFYYEKFNVDDVSIQDKSQAIKNKLMFIIVDIMLQSVGGRKLCSAKCMHSRKNTK